MLFTGKGDDGTTNTFGCDQRISKSSEIAEALGSVDEINSLLGIVKLKGGNIEAVANLSYHALISEIQNDLFIVQAQLAGAKKAVTDAQVKKLSNLVNAIEKELPPINTFFISGGTELSAISDVARAVSRRAERRVVDALRVIQGDSSILRGVVLNDNNKGFSSNRESDYKALLAYMNRLSSLCYAIARLANHRAGVAEENPHY